MGRAPWFRGFELSRAVRARPRMQQGGVRSVVVVVFFFLVLLCLCVRAFFRFRFLDFFVFSDRNISETFISDITSIDKSKEDLERSNGKEVDIRDHKKSIASASNSIRSTLQELMNKPLEIQSAFLICCYE